MELKSKMFVRTSDNEFTRILISHFTNAGAATTVPATTLPATTLPVTILPGDNPTRISETYCNRKNRKRNTVIGRRLG